MGYLIDAVTGIRNIRGELNISPSVELRADIRTASGDVEALFRENSEIFKKMARCKEVNIGPGNQAA